MCMVLRRLRPQDPHRQGGDFEYDRQPALDPALAAAEQDAVEPDCDGRGTAAVAQVELLAAPEEGRAAAGVAEALGRPPRHPLKRFPIMLCGPAVHGSRVRAPGVADRGPRPGLPRVRLPEPPAVHARGSRIERHEPVLSRQHASLKSRGGVVADGRDISKHEQSVRRPAPISTR